MKKIVVALILLLSTHLAFAAKVGTPAPDFTGTSSTAQEISLSHYHGKYVVLQWHNKDCPYVQAQYDSGNMQTLQKAWTSKGIIWLTIISSAVGKQGYVDGNGADADVRHTGAAPTATILDPTGTIGRAYRAQTTPHMFVINPEGTLIYNGAIDNHATTSKASVGGSLNYVSIALTESMAGKALSHPTSRPYGCSMKY
jgi:alkyl hydroperoxide reductase subunit AhpC